MDPVWKTKAEILVADLRVQIFTFCVCLVFSSWLYSFGVFSTALLLGSTLGGFIVANLLLINTNGRLLEHFLSGLKPSDSKSTEDQPHNRRTSKDKRKTLPFEGLTVSAELNASIEALLEEIIHQYIKNWYEGGISQDRAFIDEIRYQLRFACANLVRLWEKIDEAKFLTQEVIPLAVFHFTRLSNIKESLENEGKNLPTSTLEERISGKLTDLHLALSSRADEADYLGELADFLIPRLLDETRLAGRPSDRDSPNNEFRERSDRPWPSRPARFFIRELLGNTVLLPIFDLVTEPDTINHWLILLFANSQATREEFLQNEAAQVPFLKALSEPSVETVPDSLLQLKLSEVIRDSRQFSMFQMYLQDTRGPVNELQFLADATRILENMQRKVVRHGNFADYVQNLLKTSSSSQISYDIWQLFGQFVHESAEDRIDFDSEDVNQFQTAIESNDFQKLDKIIEKSYQMIYQRMQTDYVIPFCQSEAFYGYLCGSPPVCINELIDRETQENKNQVPEKTFSLSVLRTRVRKALTSSSEDVEDSMDSGFESNAALRNLDDPLRATEAIDESFPCSEASPLTIEVEDFCENATKLRESPIETINAAERLENSESDKETVQTGLVLDPDAHDLNSWKVNISNVATLKDSITGKTIYVFVIDVDHTHAKPHETRKWSIHRSFNEFYVLESKLNEFHGTLLRFSALPPRKAFVIKDKPFMDQHRLIFSTFLSTLCKQKVLNRSELLLAFLSSNNEFRDTLALSDLNPWKVCKCLLAPAEMFPRGEKAVMKRMPGKLTREKGQNLRPFLLKMLANTLAPAHLQKGPSVATSADSASVGPTEPTFADNSAHSFVYGNNFFGLGDSFTSYRRYYEIWTKSVVDSFLFAAFSFVKKGTSWCLVLLATLRIFSKETIDEFVYTLIKKSLGEVLCSSNLALLVQKIHESLFCYQEAPPTVQEKKMREELAKRRTQEFVENLMSAHLGRWVSQKTPKVIVGQIVDHLQLPRLNKQLFYVLLDQLLLELFPELSWGEPNS